MWIVFYDNTSVTANKSKSNFHNKFQWSIYKIFNLYYLIIRLFPLVKTIVLISLHIKKFVTVMTHPIPKFYIFIFNIVHAHILLSTSKYFFHSNNDVILLQL